MRYLARPLAFTCLSLCTLVAPTGHAFGPGTHSREATAALAALAESDPAWAEAAAAPLSGTFLAFGAISPDFQHMSDLPFGHHSAISFAMLDEAVAAGDAQRAAFALGHLCHIASDGSSEAFVVPTLFSLAPIGIFDLFEGQSAVQESELIVESYGDLITGDWDLVVDVLYDFWLGGDEAVARFDATFAWYCETGAAVTGKPVDCLAARDSLAETLELVSSLIGGLERAEAKEFVEDITALPIDELLGIAMSGLFDSLLAGAGASPGADFDREVARLNTTALVTPELWAFYDDSLADLGPAFALDFLAAGATAWPKYDAEAIKVGNLLSLMRFLPESYDVSTGFLVDALSWHDPDGAPVSELPPGLAGQTLTAHVRFFSALPLQGTVRGVVKGDLPGLDAALDPVLGEAQVIVDIDPHDYATTPRHELDIAFDADPAGLLGFYLELTVGDAPRPTFTTSWDQLWGIPSLALERPLYREEFATYGPWPSSLPVADPDVDGAMAFVVVRRAPAGAGIAGAMVSMDGGPALSTPDNGIALFGELAPGAHLVAVEAAGWAPVAPLDFTLAPLQHAWPEVVLHAVAEPTVPAPWWGSTSCVPVSWDPSPFGDQSEVMLAELLDADSGGALTPLAELKTRTGTGEVCVAADALPDGVSVRARVLPRYLDDSLGVEATSSPTSLDGSPPAIAVLGVVTGAPDCRPPGRALPYRPQTTLVVETSDAHAPITEAAWRLGGGTWQPVEPGVIDVPVAESWGALESSVELRAVNAAGLEATAEVPLPRMTELAECEEPVADPDPGPEPDAGASAEITPDVAQAGSDIGPVIDAAAEVPDPETPDHEDGCAGAGSPPAPLLATLLVLLALALALRAARAAPATGHGKPREPGGVKGSEKRGAMSRLRHLPPPRPLERDHPNTTCRRCAGASWEFDTPSGTIRNAAGTSLPSAL